MNFCIILITISWDKFIVKWHLSESGLRGTGCIPLSRAGVYRIVQIENPVCILSLMAGIYNKHTKFTSCWVYKPARRWRTCLNNRTRVNNPRSVIRVSGNWANIPSSAAPSWLGESQYLSAQQQRLWRRANISQSRQAWRWKANLFRRSKADSYSHSSRALEIADQGPKKTKHASIRSVKTEGNHRFPSWAKKGITVRPFRAGRVYIINYHN